MSSWTVDVGELIDQSQGSLLNVVSRIDADQPILQKFKTHSLTCNLVTLPTT